MPVTTSPFARLCALPVTFVVVILSVICGTTCDALGQESAEQGVARQQASAWSAFYDELYDESAKQCAAVQKSGNTGNKRARFEAAHCQARCFWASATRPGRAKAKQVWSQLAKRASRPAAQVRVAIARAVMLDGDRRRGRLPQAIETLEALCAGRPAGTATAEAAIELARLYVVAGRYDDAEVMLKSVAKRLSNLRQLEITEVAAGPFLAAAKKALKRLKYERDAGREPFEKARALQRAGQFRKALKAFEEIGQSFSQSDYAPRSQLHVGECLVGLKKPKQAVMHWGRFIIAAPAGPWRGQAHVALIDLFLEHSLDLGGAKAQAMRAYDSLSAGLDDERGAESWRASASDIYLRIGIIAYLEERYPGAAQAFEETCRQASNPKAVQQQLDPLIAAAAAGRPITPADVRGSGANEKVALALALGRIHTAARRWERAEYLFTRVQKSSPIGRPSKAQRSYAKFGLALALQGQRKPAEAKAAFLDSLQEHPKGSWHDETLFGIASLIHTQAEKRHARKPIGDERDRKGGAPRRLTAKEREQAAAEEARRLAGLRKGRAEALPYWQQLIQRHPDSPYAEVAMHSVGLLYCEAEQWKEGVATLEAFVEKYPKSVFAGESLWILGRYGIEQAVNPEMARRYFEQLDAWLSTTRQNPSEPPVGAEILIGKAGGDGPSGSHSEVTEGVQRVVLSGAIPKKREPGEKPESYTSKRYFNELESDCVKFLGFLAFVQGDNKEALRQYKRTVALDRNLIGNQGRYSDFARLKWGAEHGYLYAYPEELANYTGRHRLAVLLADFYFVTQRFDEAARMAQRLLDDDFGRLKGSARLYPQYLHATCLYWTKGRESALQEYEELLSNVRSFGGKDLPFTIERAAYAFGNVCLQTRDAKLQERGKDVLRQLADSGRTSQFACQARLAHAVILINEGNPKKGFQILESFPESSGVWRNVALQYAKIYRNRQRENKNVTKGEE